jgi:hypothetical protein
MTETEQMILDCHKRKSKLTLWEENFINTIIKKKENSLTERQLEILNDIWERIT